MREDVLTINKIVIQVCLRISCIKIKRILRIIQNSIIFFLRVTQRAQEYLQEQESMLPFAFYF
ncbi:hypothetical protein pb186bvf_001433 [Paramecium bursaria]